MRLSFDGRARTDLQKLFIYIAKDAGVDIAERYDARIRTACNNLLTYPNGGTPRDDLREGLRTVAFERRVVIEYEVTKDGVRILRIAYGGRDVAGLFPPIDAV